MRLDFFWLNLIQHVDGKWPSAEVPLHERQHGIPVTHVLKDYEHREDWHGVLVFNLDSPYTQRNQRPTAAIRSTPVSLRKSVEGVVLGASKASRIIAVRWETFNSRKNPHLRSFSLPPRASNSFV